ncbi:MAG: T9SS type A sorting domain-containing protein [Bacteroidota bacterium]|nr:T9SS type A sorting domain-containing protein [Bacteroidota bacterium]
MGRNLQFFLITVTIGLQADKVICQAPDWHWARMIDQSFFSMSVVATNEGGCYVGGGEHVIRFNDFGDHLWTIDFSDEVRLFRTADHEHAGFIMQYEEDAMAAGNSFTAAPGISFVIGFFNTDGSLYDLQNFPALLNVQNLIAIADVHRGPDGDLLLIGHFSDSLQVADTTLTGYSSSGFLARFSGVGDLQWARSLMNTTADGFGSNSAVVKQSAAGDVYINLGSPYPGSSSDTLFAQGGSAFARFSMDGELLWSLLTPGGSLAGDEVIFDLRTDGGLFYSISTLSMTTLISYFGSLDAEGQLEWETGDVEDMTVQNVYTGPADNAIFSGSRYGFGQTVVVGGCTLPNEPPRMFMIEVESDGSCDWLKQSPGQAYGFRGYAVEHPDGIYYTIGNTDGSFIVLGNDTLTFPPGGSIDYYVARLGHLPMELGPHTSQRPDLIQAHPNPFADHLILTVPQKMVGLEASLHDPMGRLVSIQQIASTTQVICLPDHASGLFLLKCGGSVLRIVRE